MRTRRPGWLAALAALSLAAACFAAGCGGEGPSGPREPVPADLILTLDGAGSGDQAVLLEIGPGATVVGPASATLEVHARPHLQGWVVAAFGSLRGQTLLRITVRDRTQPPIVEIREIATEEGALQEDLDAYQPRWAVVK